MKNFYIEIDTNFKDSLSQSAQVNLEKQIAKFPNTPEYINYLRLCPYCNKFSYVSISASRKDKFGNPTVCVLCGETNPFDKLLSSSEKANNLFSLSSIRLKKHQYGIDVKTQRVLIEQAIVVMATGLEIFFRDIFSSGMNVKFVKSKHSLFGKFLLDSKNEFINFGKANEKFKTGLNIDIKRLIAEQEVKKINELFLKRNVIVHNNGIVDTTFFNQSGVECELGEKVPISDFDISEYSRIIKLVSEKIEGEFEKIIYPEIMTRIEEF